MATDERIFPEPTPDKMYDILQDTKGIPCVVIRELFSRASVPEKVQAAFWTAARKKTLKLVTGTVSRVTAFREFILVGVSGDESPEVFFTYRPGEDVPPSHMTDHQFEEFKRAHSNDLQVEVYFQQEREDGQVSHQEVIYVEVSNPRSA